jgi:hypothetical protein
MSNVCETPCSPLYIWKYFVFYILKIRLPTENYLKKNY